MQSGSYASQRRLSILHMRARVHITSCLANILNMFLRNLVLCHVTQAAREKKMLKWLITPEKEVARGPNANLERLQQVVLKPLCYNPCLLEQPQTGDEEFIALSQAKQRAKKEERENQQRPTVKAKERVHNQMATCDSKANTNTNKDPLVQGVHVLATSLMTHVIP
eukprot:454166-Amphidinium_carterae.1